MARFGFLCTFICLITCTAQARPLNKIKSSGEIRICWSPWLGKDTPANYPSAGRDLAIIFAKHLHVKPKLIKVNWNDLFKDKSGTAQIGETYEPNLMANEMCDLYSHTLEDISWRRKIIDIVPLYLSRSVVVTRVNPTTQIRNVLDLQNKSTSVVKDTSYSQLLTELNQNESVLHDNPIKINYADEGGTRTSLLEKKVDFIVYGLNMAMFSKTVLKLPIAIAFPLGELRSVGWGVRQDNKSLTDEIKRFLKIEQQSGYKNFSKVFLKYFGMDYQKYCELMLVATKDASQ